MPVTGDKVRMLKRVENSDRAARDMAKPINERPEEIGVIAKGEEFEVGRDISELEAQQFVLTRIAEIMSDEAPARPVRRRTAEEL